MKRSRAVDLLQTALVLLMGAASLASCSQAPGQPQVLSVRQQLEQQVDLARKAPLVLRWNPAPCDCPPFEAQLSGGWIRADLRGGDLEKLQQWTAFLASLPPESLPVAVSARGQLERGVWRLANGNYAARVDIAEPLSPLAPPTAAVESVPP